MPEFPNFDIDEVLEHAKVYDPVKARDYYLRTRKLKGRNAGRSDQAIKRKLGIDPSSEVEDTRSLKKRRADVKPPSAKARAERVHAEVEALKGRLVKLQAALKQLVANAESKGSSEKKSDTTTKESSDKSEPKEKLSATEKKKAAERSKDWRKENPTKPEPKEKSVEELRAQIAEIKKKLQAAVEEARSKSKVQSETASKGR